MARRVLQDMPHGQQLTSIQAQTLLVGKCVSGQLTISCLLDVMIASGHFSSLRPSALSTLSSNANWLKSRGARVLLCTNLKGAARRVRIWE